MTGEVPAAGLEDRLDDREDDDADAEADDQVKIGLIEAVDDLPDEHGRQGRDERADDRREPADEQPRAVRLEVHPERPARRQGWARVDWFANLSAHRSCASL